MPTNPKDKVGMLNYVKNAYNRLTTLTKLEVTRGQPVPGLEEYYLSNQFLKKVHRVLPEELGSQFLMKLQENGESYYLMKGKQYMDRMISLLRCCYKSLEIALEDYPPQQSGVHRLPLQPGPGQPNYLVKKPVVCRLICSAWACAQLRARNRLLFQRPAPPVNDDAGG
jgi:hypothetical protein